MSILREKSDLKYHVAELEVVPDTKKGYNKMSEYNKTNGLLVVLSVLIPIVGYVLYFVKKDKEPDAAKNYLWSAIAGSVIGLIFMA